ncbi:SMP-30/gluconolactonase/LRE family protein [Sedimentisphaera salicampi]|uniref:Glutathione peroxidase n=1 Tax=Sedimentisphaera salicampi TaxID=1941349 RepID=A0A1W6LMN3_9BACT|nr:SMP-30/gluconolactonase/LRE family protein [Sedimentisphaera salicampi]ARN57048.1 putative gluconolactonase [Sedimentisphaera salicampi]
MFARKLAIITFAALIPAFLLAESSGEHQKPYKLKKLADSFAFTEGPAADSNGNIFFTDIPNNKIHIYTDEGKLKTFLKGSKGANGLAFDESGNLIACMGSAGKVASIDPEKNIKTLAGEYKSKPFNSPNDLWLTPEGGIYFTDPRYGRRDNLPQDGEHVYYLPPDKSKPIRVIDDMVRPNGIVGDPARSLLYVADAGAGKTYSYKPKPDGTLSEKKLFVEFGSDGMTLDSQGNLYITNEKVMAFNPEGKQILTIDTPERPSNLCFASNKEKKLFITARTSLYCAVMENRLYSFTVNDIDSSPVSLSEYQGRVVLVVNVASKCGFTKQYAELQELYEKYKDEGFTVLGFPANNFANQEPGSNAEIKNFCTSKFNVTFPMFSKISVKGKDIHPLYDYLTDKSQSGENAHKITWNFNKFLINRAGNTIAYFGSRTSPMDKKIVQKIEKALQE